MKYTFAFLISLILLAPVTGRAQWEQTQHTAGGDIVSLAVIGDHVLASTIIGPNYYSTDNGSSWWNSNLPYPATYASITFARNGSEIFAGSNGEDNLDEGYVGQGVFVSMDSGVHWTERNNGLTNQNVVALASSGGNLFAACSYWVNTNVLSYYSSVYRSTDSGQSWTACNNGLHFIHGINTIVAMDTDLILGCSDSIYRSTDQGASWKSLIREQVNRFAVVGNSVFAGTYDSGIVRSTDRGNHWIAPANGLPSNVTIENFALRDSLLFAAVDTRDSVGNFIGSVYISTDSGASWQNKTSGLPTDGILSLATNATYVFAGTSNFGVWRRSLADILGLAGVKPEPPPMKSFPSLTQIGNRLTAQFQDNFEIQILNLLGAEMLSKRGSGTLDLDLSSLPAGVYFAIVQAGDAREVRRIAVVH